MSIITATKIPSPFRGLSSVIELRFPFDAALNALLKHALAEVRRHAFYDPGRWSPSQHCWHIETPAWPAIYQRLLDAGYVVEGAAEILPE